MELMRVPRSRSPAGTGSKTPPRRRASVPPSVPTHKSPERDTNRAVIRLSPSAGVLFVLRMTKREPSNRARPWLVPTHK